VSRFAESLQELLAIFVDGWTSHCVSFSQSEWLTWRQAHSRDV
jgi:hypothetical protein